MKMKLLDYTLICILGGLVKVAGAQTAPAATQPATAPGPAQGSGEVECTDAGCGSDQGVLFELRTRGKRQPVTHGTTERSSSETLQPDRRVTIQAEDTNST